ncbi:hypothetical protein THASP1DRAFT_5613, partial [Thamnocephalis sphaerospora]
FDLNALMEDILANKERYGFTVADKPCLDPTTNAKCANPEQHLFWDAFHPTTKVHEMFA